MKRIRIFGRSVYVLLLTMLVACDMFKEHPYDVDTDGYHDLNAAAVAVIERECAGLDTLRIAVTGDTQGWYDDTRDFVRDVNRRDGIHFVVHTGDLSDYGTTQEFLWQREILHKLRVPYVTVIGNHDCLGTGKEVYRKLYGPTNYAFIAGGVKFVMLNTNALEYDYSEPIPNLDFIEEQITERESEFTRTIVTMHAKPYSDVFNDNVATPFAAYLRHLPGLMFCLNGHDHVMEQNDIMGDGVIYYQTANIARRSYYIFTITPDGYDYETIDF